MPHVAPGRDAFPEEQQAEELAARLAELSAALRSGPDRAAGAIGGLLAQDFKGGRLTPIEELQTAAGSALEIFRSKTSAPILDRDRRAFLAEWTSLLADFATIDVAEFLIIRIERIGATGETDSPIRTTVRYDITGAARQGHRAERLGRWQMIWKRTGGVWHVAEWSASDQVRSHVTTPVFAEVTEAAFGGNAQAFQQQLRYGSDAWLSSLDAALQLDTMALHGLAVGDADGDGLDDLYVSQPSGLPNRLLRNRGDGTFEDITERAGVGVLDSTSHALFVDIDNDGDQDLVLVTRTELLLFVNDGKAHFTRVPDAFRFKEPLRGSPTSIAVADFDRDGFLDIYLCTYSYFIGSSEDKGGPATPYHDAKNGPPNVLFRNDGTAHFVDVTAEVGLSENNDRFSLAAAWADYDGDGWVDLLVANDFGRKNLYHNEGVSNGHVHFKDVAPAAGVEDYGAGMSASWLDYDNDGRLDIYTGNMWTAAGLRVTSEPGFMPDAPADIRALYARHARGNSLFHNSGDGTFADVTLASRTAMGRWAWTADAVDFDLDGWDDLYVVNGMFTRAGDAHDLDSFFWRQVVAKSPMTKRPGTPFDDGWRAINRLLVADGSQASHERNVFMRNDSHGGFDDISGLVGLDLDQDGRSFAAIDYDGDGDPDIVVYAPRSSPQLRLFRNDFASGNAALAVRLRGTRSNRDAIGASVTVEAGGVRRTKVVLAGSGFLSQRPKELLFGLGKSRGAVTVSVRWPSGTTETFSDVLADQRVRIEEGRAAIGAEPLKRSAPASRVSITRPAPATELAAPATWLVAPFPAPSLNLHDLEGREHSLFAARGKPALLLFWSAAAPSSVATLRSLGASRDALTKAGVSLLPVAVDASQDEPKVRAAAQGSGLAVMMGTEEITGAFSILHRYLFARREDLRLPTLLLINKEGDVVKVYRDRIEVSQVVADLPNIDASPSERLTRAAPFPGMFYTPPESRNAFQYALELGEQGFDLSAIAAFDGVVAAQPSAIALFNLGTLEMKSGRTADATAAFRRALELKPDYAEANNSLGALLAQSGDIGEAQTRFRAALAANPDNADALNNLGFALFQSGQSDEAFDLYQRALKARPDFPEALNNVGIFYGRQGQLDRAEPYFRQAVEKRPAYGEAANNLALVLARRGDPDGAIAVLERCLKENPAFEMGYVTLCRIYLNMGRQQQAQQVLQALLQRNPKHPAGLQLLQQTRGGRG